VVATSTMHKDWTTGEINNRFLVPAMDGRILTKSSSIDANTMILNGKFDFGQACWAFWSNNGGAGMMSVVNGELKTAITNSATNIWDIGMTQAGVPVENGCAYAVSFRARADVPCRIICMVQVNHDPWTIYSGNDAFEIGPAMTEYSYAFTMGQPTDMDAKFVFQVGAIGSATVYIDDVRMRKVH